MTIDELPNIVYHGTISIHKNSLISGIDINKGYRSADFGQGFYTTSNYEQAKDIANGRANAYSMKKHIDVAPMIVSFYIDKDILNSYRGKIFDDIVNSKWKEFIYNNRVGLEKIVSNFHNLNHKYHYVYGFVADSNIINMTREVKKDLITYGDFANNLKPLKGGSYDQLSFHSDDVVKSLRIENIELLEREEILV